MKPYTIAFKISKLESLKINECQLFILLLSKAHLDLLKDSNT